MFIGTKLTKLSNTIAFIEQNLNKKDKNASTTSSDGMFFVFARKKKGNYIHSCTNGRKT